MKNSRRPFPWYSSGDGDFNYDFDVSFHPEFMMGEGSVRYNFAAIEPRMTDLPGISAFVKEADGAVYRPIRPTRAGSTR